MGWDSSLSDHVSEAVSTGKDTHASDTPFAQDKGKPTAPKALNQNKDDAHNDTLDSRIHELVLYARDKDSADRSNLFRNLVDMFLTNKAPRTEPTRGQLLDVLEALIPHTDEEFRRTAAELVASMTEPPLDLVMRLIQDRASIIHPLLRQANFTEEDLIDIIERTGRAHHQELASRNDLSANVWIALARAAPTIEPKLNETALWNDDIFRKKQSATITPLYPDKHTGLAPSTATKPDQAPIDALDTEQDTSGIFLETDQQAQVQSYDQRKKASVTTVTALTKQTSAHTIGTTGGDHKDELKLSKNTNAGPLPNTEAKPKTADSEEIAASWLFDDDDIRAFSDTPKTDGDQQRPGNESRDQSDERPTNPVKKWDWHCDRRMVVTEINHLSSDIVESLTFREGSDLIDLLGLSEKPNHPIVKAINRRGTIHDAPLYLKKFPKGHRYWTLEAKPSFCLNTGNFQGYDGCLTGVLPSSTDDNFELPDSLPPAKIHIPDEDSVLDGQALPDMAMPKPETLPRESANHPYDDFPAQDDATENFPSTEGMIEQALKESLSLSSIPQTQDDYDHSAKSNQLIKNTEDQISALEKTIQSTVESYVGALDIQDMVHDIQSTASDAISQTDKSAHSHQPASEMPAAPQNGEQNPDILAAQDSDQTQMPPAFWDALQQMEVALNALSQLDLSNPQAAEKSKHRLKLNQTIALACLQSIKDQLGEEV